MASGSIPVSAQPVFSFPPDSAELQRIARRAQRSFEVLHRGRLPKVPDTWRGGDCDEILGRICLRYGGGSLWVPKPEEPALIRARQELLATLEEVGRAIPGDRWVLGQRVRYLGDMGRWEEALALARACPQPDTFWCQGLMGYVLHRAGDSEASLQVFEGALRALGPEEAARWRDPSLLLGEEELRWLKNPWPLSREEAVRRFWLLADPLFLTPGNEALAEHLARRFASNLYRDSALTMELSWDRWTEELLLRYGFPAGWEQTEPGMGEFRGRVVERHHPESRGLLPPREALEDPSGLPEGVWTPQDRRPRSTYAPVLAPLVAEGEGQTAVLRRGGEVLVLAAFGAPADTFLLRRRPREGGAAGASSAVPQPGSLRVIPWEPSTRPFPPDTLAGLFLLPESGGERLEVTGKGASGVLQLRAPPGRYLLSLEQWSPQGRWGSRLRHGLRADPLHPDLPALSDLLVFRPGDTIPRALEEILGILHPTLRLSSREPVGVAWEVYGLGPRAEFATFHLSLVREEGGAVRTALERLGLLRKAPVLTLSWTEGELRGPGEVFRALRLELPPLSPGRYLLRLEMSMASRDNVLSSRRLQLY